MARFDWEYFKQRYATGPDSVTLQALAELPNAPALATLKRHSVAERWQTEREAYRAQTATKTLEHASTDLAGVRASHLLTGRRLTEIGSALLELLDPLALTPRDALAFIVAGCEIERKALEMSEFDLSPDLKRLNGHDITKLSDAELDALAERIDYLSRLN